MSPMTHESLDSQPALHCVYARGIRYIFSKMQPTRLMRPIQLYGLIRPNYIRVGYGTVKKLNLIVHEVSAVVDKKAVVEC